jgi:hypothetical protein
MLHRDEDELEDRIEQLNKRGLEIIKSATGLSKLERQRKVSLSSHLPSSYLR